MLVHEQAVLGSRAQNRYGPTAGFSLSPRPDSPSTNICCQQVLFWIHELTAPPTSPLWQVQIVLLKFCNAGVPAQRPRSTRHFWEGENRLPLLLLKAPTEGALGSCHTRGDSAMEGIKCFHESLYNLPFYAITIHPCLRKFKKRIMTITPAASALRSRRWLWKC